MKTVYLDHSATTPVDPEVLKEMLLYFSDEFGNASSQHSVGQVAAEIRKVRPPERYHGTGIRYQGEEVKLKAGKSGKTGK